LTKLHNATTSFTVGHFDSEVLGLTSSKPILDITKMLTNIPKFLLHTKYIATAKMWVRMAI